MRTFGNEKWDWPPEPLPRRERHRTATPMIELTLVRSKRSLTTRIADAYIGFMAITLKAVAGAVLGAMIVACVWLMITLIRLSVS